MPEICFHPPNVCHEFWDRIENVGFYTHPRSMFPPPNVLHKFRDRIENVFFSHPRNMFPPPNVLHKYRERIKNVGFYTTGSPPDFGKSKSKWVGEPDYTPPTLEMSLGLCPQDISQDVLGKSLGHRGWISQYLCSRRSVFLGFLGRSGPT